MAAWCVGAGLPVRRQLSRAVVHGQKAGVVIGTSPGSLAKVFLVGPGVLAAIALIAVAVRQFA